MCFRVYCAGLCSPSVYRGGWEWMLPFGWQNPVYEVPHQASQASCPVIGWSSISQCIYESNPKAQDLFICRFCLLNRAFFSIHVQVLAWMCFVKRYVCMQINGLLGRLSAEVMYCAEKKCPCILYFRLCLSFIVFLYTKAYCANSVYAKKKSSLNCTRIIWFRKKEYLKSKVAFLPSVM